MRTILVAWLLCFCSQSFSIAQNQHVNPKNIGQTTIEFFDDSRSRKVTTEIWYPTDDSIAESDKNYSPFKRSFTVRDATPVKGEHPLILFSHGNGGSRTSMEWLAQSLVDKGYIVAAVDHWGNTFDHKIAIEFIKPWERPLDLSVSLTQLLDHNVFGRVINPDRIGALGFSYGGYTVIALGGAVLDYPTLLNYYKTEQGLNDIAQIREFPNLAEKIRDKSFIEMTKNIPELKDDRIQSIFAISPGTAMGFRDESQFKALDDMPVFIIGCEADQVTPVVNYARHYHSLIKHSEYYEFKGEIGHYVMLAEANDQVKKEAPHVFVDHPSVDRNQVHQKVSDLAIGFFEKNL